MSMAQSPCRYCGTAIIRTAHRRTHEQRCPQNPSIKRRKRNPANIERQEQANQRVRDLFARVDVTQDLSVQEQLLALGLPSSDVARKAIRRAIELGCLSAPVRRRRGANRSMIKERFSERVRLVFKDIRLDRPLSPQLRERGENPKTAHNMAVRAGELGLVPPGFHFPTHEPLDMRKAPKPPSKPKARSKPEPQALPLERVEPAKPKAPAKLTYSPPQYRCDVCGYEASNRFRFDKHKCVPDDEDV